jgi:hypothetical protein
MRINGEQRHRFLKSMDETFMTPSEWQRRD